MNNSEKIKSMTQDELANFLIRISKDFKFTSKEDAVRFLNADEYLLTKEFTLNDAEKYTCKRVSEACIGSLKSFPIGMTAERFINCLFLDSSDIFQRCSDEPYSKILLDICAELWPRREGYTKIADNYKHQNNW